MKFFHFHDLNSPDKEVLVNESIPFNVSPAPAGTGSLLVFENGQVIYVHESREEIETITAE